LSTFFKKGIAFVKSHSVNKIDDNKSK